MLQTVLVISHVALPVERQVSKDNYELRLTAAVEDCGHPLGDIVAWASGEYAVSVGDELLRAVGIGGT